MSEDAGDKPEKEAAEEPATPEAKQAKEKTVTPEAAADAAPKATESEKEPKKEAQAAPEAAATTPPPSDPKKPKDIFAELDPSEKEQPKILKSKSSKNVHSGILPRPGLPSTTPWSRLPTCQGMPLGWSSSGKMGFRGSRKSTAYAGQIVSQDACKQAMSHGLKEIEVRVTGPGSGREAAVRAAQGLGLHVHTIKDVTPHPSQRLPSHPRPGASNILLFAVRNNHAIPSPTFTSLFHGTLHRSPRSRSVAVSAHLSSALTRFLNAALPLRDSTGEVASAKNPPSTRQHSQKSRSFATSTDFSRNSSADSSRKQPRHVE